MLYLETNPEHTLYYDNSNITLFYMYIILYLFLYIEHHSISFNFILAFVIHIVLIFDGQVVSGEVSYMI